MKKHTVLSFVLAALLLSAAIGAATPVALATLGQLHHTLAEIPFGCRLETVSGVGFACLSGRGISSVLGPCPGWLPPASARFDTGEVWLPLLADVQPNDLRPYGRGPDGPRPEANLQVTVGACRENTDRCQ